MRTAFLGAAVLALAAPPVRAWRWLRDPVWESPQGDSREDQLYEQGTKALDDGDWDRAAPLLTKVAKNNGARADPRFTGSPTREQAGAQGDALAWLAGFSASSRELLDKDVRAWNWRSASREAPRPSGVENDEDLKLMAINSLLNTDPERAVPLEKF